MASRRILAQGPLADRHLVEVERTSIAGRKERRAGDDEVDAARLEFDHPAPLDAFDARSPRAAGGTRRGERELVEQCGTCAPRGATMAAMSSRVPLLPTTSFGRTGAPHAICRNDVVVRTGASIRFRDGGRSGRIRR
jgi:hypothetical protein